MINNCYLEKIILNDIVAQEDVGKALSIFSVVSESSEYTKKVAEFLGFRAVTTLKEFDDLYISDMDGYSEFFLNIAKRERFLIAKEKIHEEEDIENILKRKQYLITSNLKAVNLHLFNFSEIILATDIVTSAYLPENDGLKENYTQDEAEEYIDSILETSIVKNVSDIHIRGKSNGIYEIKFRIDNELGKPFDTKPAEFMEVCIRVLKFRAGVDVASKDPSQDGQFETVIGGKKNSWRFAAALQDSGMWKITIRKAHKFGTSASFEELGYHPRVIEMIQKVMLIENGMVILAGKPGTGKTTLLYMTLLELARKYNYEVQTIENPVEQKFEELTQINVNRNYSFAEAIRSCMRLNPDVLLIGEIRDEETAKAAFSAASSGIKAFSTVHAGTVLMTPKRLLGLGITELDMAESIKSIFAQRLIPTLCPNCKIHLPNGKCEANTSLENTCPKCSKNRNIGYAGVKPINQAAIFKEDILSISKDEYEDYIDYLDCLEYFYANGDIDKKTFEWEKRRLGEEDTEEIEIINTEGNTNGN